MWEVDAYITVVLGQLINCPRHIGVVAADFIDLTMELFTVLSSFFSFRNILIGLFLSGVLKNVLMVLQIVLDLNDLRKIPTFEERFTLPAINIRLVVVPTFVMWQLWHLDNYLTPSIIVVNINMWSFCNDRQDSQGEVADQAIHFPFAVPKLTPGRLYVKFGKPIITAGVYSLTFLIVMMFLLEIQMIFVDEHLERTRVNSTFFLMYATNLLCKNWQEEKRSCKSRKTQTLYTNMWRVRWRGVLNIFRYFLWTLWIVYGLLFCIHLVSFGICRHAFDIQWSYIPNFLHLFHIMDR